MVTGLKWRRRASTTFAGILGVLGGGCETWTPPSVVPERLEGPAMLITTTDFSTGALSVYDLEAGTLYRDVASASPDAIPFSDGEYVYVLNRFMHDYVSVYDPYDGFALVAEHAIVSATATSTNPHGLAFVATGRAVVSLYGASEVQIHDFLGAPGASLVASVDMSTLADEDEVAETEFAYVHEGRAWVLSHPVNRLDGWTPVGFDQLVEVDVMDPALIDLEPGTSGVQGIPLPCAWSREHRAHPTQPGHLLVLCEGVVDVDLDAATWDWHVPPEYFPGGGEMNYLQPQDFVVSEDGATTVVAIYTADFSEVELWAVHGDAAPQLLVGGLQSAERSLELYEDELFFGDRSVKNPGVRRFSLGGEALSEVESTGLAPYALGAWRLQ